VNMGRDTNVGANVRADMAQQGETLQNILDGSSSINTIVEMALEHKPPVIVWFARGSSAHAVQACVPILTNSMKIPWVQGDVSAHLHGPMNWPAGTLFLVASQSGDTPDLVSVARRLLSESHPLITMSNAGGSLKEISQAHLSLLAGLELGVPATKSVFAQIMTLLVAAQGTLGTPAERKHRIIQSVAKVSNSSSSLLLDSLGGHLPLAAIGSGSGLGLAREWAHKVQETSGLPVVALDSAEFEHGPVAIARPGKSIVAFTAGNIEATRAGIIAARKRGATVAQIGEADIGSILNKNDCSQGWDLLPDLISAQKLCMALAESLGFDPDIAFGLSKITKTIA